jgi:hypothetical protein
MNLQDNEIGNVLFSKLNLAGFLKISHMEMHVYDSRDENEYECRVSFISDIHQPFILLCPDAAEVLGSNPSGPTTP